MVHSNRMIMSTSKVEIGRCRWLACTHAVETLIRRTPYRRVQCKAAPSDVFILDVGVLLNNSEEVCEPLARLSAWLDTKSVTIFCTRYTTP